MANNRNTLALYRSKDEDEWGLITREVSTKKSAEKKTENYKRAGYEIKYIEIE